MAAGHGVEVWLLKNPAKAVGHSRYVKEELWVEEEGEGNRGRLETRQAVV